MKHSGKHILSVVGLLTDSCWSLANILITASTGNNAKVHRWGSTKQRTPSSLRTSDLVIVHLFHRRKKTDTFIKKSPESPQTSPSPPRPVAGRLLLEPRAQLYFPFLLLRATTSKLVIICSHRQHNQRARLLLADQRHRRGSSNHSQLSDLLFSHSHLDLAMPHWEPVEMPPTTHRIPRWGLHIRVTELTQKPPSIRLCLETRQRSIRIRQSSNCSPKHIVGAQRTTSATQSHWRSHASIAQVRSRSCCKFFWVFEWRRWECGPGWYTC